MVWNKWNDFNCITCGEQKIMHLNGPIFVNIWLRKRDSERFLFYWDEGGVSLIFAGKGRIKIPKKLANFRIVLIEQWGAEKICFGKIGSGLVRIFAKKTRENVPKWWLFINLLAEKWGKLDFWKVRISLWVLEKRRIEFQLPNYIMSMKSNFVKFIGVNMKINRSFFRRIINLNRMIDDEET